MKILVTGSEGYIGANLVRFLKQQGHTVKTLDRNNRFQDCTVQVFVEQQMRNTDWVCHLAGVSGIKACEERPQEAEHVNINGTRVVCRWAKHHGVGIILASTIGAKNPQNWYSRTKVIAEIETLQHNGIVFRMSNVYGGYKFTEKKQTVIANFLKHKRLNSYALLEGNGSQRRDFIHVDDVCLAFLHAMNTPLDSNIYEVCSGKMVSILDVADLFGFTNYMYAPKRTNEVDIETDRRQWLPGWSPSITIAEWVETAIKQK